MKTLSGILHKVQIKEIGIEQAHEQILALFSVSQQRELLEALKGIIQCCDGNEPKHEQIYHIANDAVKACNCGQRYAAMMRLPYVTTRIKKK